MSFRLTPGPMTLDELLYLYNTLQTNTGINAAGEQESAQDPCYEQD